VKKVESLFERWQALKKNASRHTETQQNNEAEFTDGFDDLFDIAHANALDMIQLLSLGNKLFLLPNERKAAEVVWLPLTMCWP